MRLTETLSQAPTPFVQTPPAVIEDPLAHLPVSAIGEYRRGETIYGTGKPSAGLYVVLAGKVKVCREAADGQQVVVDVYQTDDFFGESALVGAPSNEFAVALDSVRVMSWNAKDIRDLSLRRPELGLSLLQLSVGRSVEFANRIQSFSLENIENRLIGALLRFSDKLGAPANDGGREMIAFTHELISQYVGTSREIVTHYMNALRRKQCLNYSRKSIVVYDRALSQLAERGGIAA